MFNRKKFKSKFIISFILILLVFQMTGIGVLFFPKDTKAQSLEDMMLVGQTAGVAPGLPVTDIGQKVQGTLDKILEVLKKAFIFGTTVALRNAVMQMVQQFAYDMAVAMASAATGQEPLIFQQSMGDYFQGILEDGAGEFIGTLSEESFKQYGFDLCAPSLDVLLGIQYLMINENKPPEPKCDWAQISANWEAFSDTFKDPRDFLNHFKLSFTPSQNPINIAMTLNDRLEVFNTQKYTAGLMDRLIGQGYKSQTSAVGGYILTPADVLRNQMNESITEMQKSGKSNSDMALNVLSDIPEQALDIALSTFVNTLASKLLQKMISGLFPLGDLIFGPEEDVFGSGSMTKATSGGAEQAAERFSFLNKPNLEFTSSIYDSAAEFASCPTDYATPNNCVIDNKFYDIINSAKNGTPMTVQDALDQGLLDSGMPLISSSDPRNKDEYCYTEGYCYSNLVKLRKARIIPIGWEIAAENSPDTDPWTLGLVVQGFYDCQIDGEGNVVPDASHPYCHLIDPNWVIKEPLTQCRSMAYTQAETPGTGSRVQMCVDAPTCVSEDEDGNCKGGWEYCTKEKSVWRFAGDSCPGQYDSCRALNNVTTGANASYLINTIDYGNCTADNVGCKWYSTKRDTAAEDALAAAGTVSSVWDENAKIYFDKEINDNTCTDRSEGCTEFIRTANGLGTNLAPNNSFEYYTGFLDDVLNQSSFYGWSELSSEGSVPTTYAVSTALDGSAALSLTYNADNKEHKFGQQIKINPEDSERYFILSLAVYIPGGELSGSARLWFDESTMPQQSGVDRNFTPASPIATNYDLIVDNGNAKNTWLTKSGVYKLAPFVDEIRIGVKNNNEDGQEFSGGIYLDSFSLTEIFNPTDSAPAYSNYKTNNLLYLTAAPNYYNCYDDDLTNDNAKCANFAQKCESKDVGCELFSPTLNGAKTGDFDVPGQVFRKDYCPSECVGYETFSQTGTVFEKYKYPMYFIPQTAKVCDAAAAGCDEFTNLDVLAAGGEGIEYYSYLRQCVQPEDTTSHCGAFYTWESSEVSGYQLQTYNLDRESTASKEPRVVNAEENCDESIYLAKTNPDCKEFYYVDPTTGSVTTSYHLFTNTVTCSDDCKPYRRTIYDAADCPASNQTKIAGQDACVYYAIPNQGTTCGSQSAGCREYTGNAGANVRNVIFDDFESGYDSWSCMASNSTVPCELSSEGAYIQENSLALSSPVIKATRDLAGTILPNKSYTLSFWAKGKAAGPASVTFASYYPSQIINLTTNWKEYTFGPINTPSILLTGDLLSFYKGNTDFYLDKVILKEVFANVYALKNSWTTPSSCDKTLDGYSAPQAMLGCSEYLDRFGTIHYLNSFSNICSQDKVGCEALVDTKNSENPYGITMPAGTYSATSVDYKKACEGITITLNFAPLKVSWHEEDQKCHMDNYNIWIEDLNNITTEATTNEDGDLVLGGSAFDAFIQEFIQEGLFLELDPSDSTTPEWTPSDIHSDESLAFKKLCTVNLGGTWDSQYKDCSLPSTDIITLPDDELMYLVNDDAYACPDTDASCTAFGVPTITNINLTDASDYQEVTGWTDAYFLNDPDNYNEILCSQGDVGCEEYTTSDGESLYFRDPGDRLCEYREVQDPSSGQTNGAWYKKGVADEECVMEDTNVPTLTKNTTNNFDGWTGECPSGEDMCTKFVDPLDTSNISHEGKSYYFINNDNLDKTSCEGSASLQKGCVLFKDTSNPILNYNSEATYSNSAENNYDKVAVVNGLDESEGCIIGDYIVKGCVKSGTDCTFTNGEKDSCSNLTVEKITQGERITEYQCKDISTGDIIASGEDCLAAKSDTNVILKVTNDRVCGEWLACRSKRSVWDEATSTFKDVCDDIDACTDFKATSSADTAQCSNWGIRETDPSIIDEDSYVKRAVSWNDMDLSGYSIPDVYPLQYLDEVDFSKTADTYDYKLARILPTKECSSKNYGEECYDNAGDCINGECVQGADGSVINNTTLDINTFGIECRNYPESNSPFPSEMAASTSNTMLTNFCDPGQNCDCNYQKQSFGNNQVVRYYGEDTSVLALYPGVCSGGFYADGTPRDGSACNSDLECHDSRYDMVVINDQDIHPDVATFGTDTAPGTFRTEFLTQFPDLDLGQMQEGTCLKVDPQLNKYIGWKGYCLEHDLSKNIEYNQNKYFCESWYPVDSISGVDIFNQYDNAGFVGESNQKYCLVGDDSNRFSDYNRFDQSPNLNASDAAPVNGLECAGGDCSLDYLRNIQCATEACSSRRDENAAKLPGDPSKEDEPLCKDCSTFYSTQQSDSNNVFEDIAFTFTSDLPTESSIYSFFRNGNYENGFTGNDIRLGTGIVTGTLYYVVDDKHKDQSGKFTLSIVPYNAVTKKSYTQQEVLNGSGLSVYKDTIEPLKISDIKRIRLDFYEPRAEPGCKDDQVCVEYPNTTKYLSPDNNWELGWCLFSTECPFPSSGLVREPLDFNCGTAHTGCSNFYEKGDAMSGGYATDIFKDTDGACGATANNILGIKANFDPNGRLTGFDWGLCDGTADTGGVGTKVTIELNDSCEFVAEVTGNTGDNKAFTNEIWQDNMERAADPEPFNVGPKNVNFILYNYDLYQYQYNPLLLPVAGYENIDPKKYITYSSDAAPFGKIFQSNRTGGFLETKDPANFLQINAPFGPQSGTNEVRSNSFYSSYAGLEGGENVDSSQPPNPAKYATFVQTREYAQNILQLLFAKIYKVYRYENDDPADPAGQFSYVDKTSNQNNLDITMDAPHGATGGTAPVIAGVSKKEKAVFNSVFSAPTIKICIESLKNTGAEYSYSGYPKSCADVSDCSGITYDTNLFNMNCVDTNKEDIDPQYWEDLGIQTDGGSVLNTISVGTKSSGNIEAKNGYYLGDIKFYAWANTDHMPLTKVIVDYGNESQPKETTGKYQNHKALCSLGSEPVYECSNYSGYTCEKNAGCPSDSNCVPVFKSWTDSGLECADVDVGTSVEHNYGTCLTGSDMVCKNNPTQRCLTAGIGTGCFNGSDDECVAIKRCENDLSRICDYDNECSLGGKCRAFGLCSGNAVDPIPDGMSIPCNPDEEPGACKVMGECVNSGYSFGNSPDACFQGYFHYSTTYTCTANDVTTVAGTTAPSGMPNCNTINENNTDTLATLGFIDGCYSANYTAKDGVTKGACIYQPRVQVTDNWDWCNGETYGAGAHDDTSTGGSNFCANDDAFWTYYNGKIIVFP